MTISARLKDICRRRLWPNGRKLAWPLGLFLGVAICLASTCQAKPPELSFGGEKVPLSRPEVHESVDQQLLLLSEAKSRVWLTLRRSSRYLPIIENALKSQNVPLDFKYLPMALANLSPDYRNGARRGLWRLSEAEAASMGLKINKEVDERLDPVASSAAAAAKIASLKKSYGTWTMALSAFLDATATNTAMAEAGSKDYYSLYVPETLDQNVSLVLAGKVLYSDLSAYGYRTGQSWPVLANGRRLLDSPASLKTAAENYKIDIRTFRDMNPHILTDTAPAGSYLNIP
ncbi:MAG: transglycosylase SLT domain-containing protein [Deltaproteobacteria bacterium]|nr:transglycosylase SLT domain-containing protein [Deltaproteobacteria bacterium]